jgi:hypothetical protein
MSSLGSREGGGDRGPRTETWGMFRRRRQDLVREAEAPARQALSKQVCVLQRWSMMPKLKARGDADDFFLTAV